jgi:hypothetical protein
METAARGEGAGRRRRALVSIVRSSVEVIDMTANFPVRRSLHCQAAGGQARPRPAGRWIASVTWTAALNMNTRMREPRDGHVMVGGRCPVASPPRSAPSPTWQRRTGSTPLRPPEICVPSIVR